METFEAMTETIFKDNNNCHIDPFNSSAKRLEQAHQWLMMIQI